jgi:hypothetical protein
MTTNSRRICPPGYQTVANSPYYGAWIPEYQKRRLHRAGWFNTDELAPPEAVYRLSGTNEEIHLLDSVEDTLVQVSDIFTDPELTYVNPAVKHKTLLAGVDFVSRIAQQMHKPDDVFDPSWCTLVAGKNDSDSAKALASFSEVFSILVDESSGRSPTLTGQPYAIVRLRIVCGCWRAAMFVFWCGRPRRIVCIEGRVRLVGECFVHGTMSVEGDAVAQRCTGHAWGIALWFNCFDRVRIGSSSRRKPSRFRSLAILPDVGR